MPSLVRLLSCLLVSIFATRGDENVVAVLLGVSGGGKSTTGNLLLGRSEFQAKSQMAPVTIHPTSASTLVHGRRLVVVDAPGPMTHDEATDSLVESMLQLNQHTPEGFDVALITVPVDRFAEDQDTALHALRATFGAALLDHAIIVFTKSTLNMQEMRAAVRADLRRARGGREPEVFVPGFLQWWEEFEKLKCPMAVVREGVDGQRADRDALTALVLQTGVRQSRYASPAQRRAAAVLAARQERVKALEYPDLEKQGSRLLVQLQEGQLRLRDVDSQLEELERRTWPRQEAEQADSVPDAAKCADGQKPETNTERLTVEVEGARGASARVTLEVTAPRGSGAGLQDDGDAAVVRHLPAFVQAVERLLNGMEQVHEAAESESYQP